MQITDEAWTVILVTFFGTPFVAAFAASGLLSARGRGAFAAAVVGALAGMIVLPPLIGGVWLHGDLPGMFVQTVMTNLAGAFVAVAVIELLRRRPTHSN